jgi:hypothetical protein
VTLSEAMTICAVPMVLVTIEIGNFQPQGNSYEATSNGENISFVAYIDRSIGDLVISAPWRWIILAGNCLITSRVRRIYV